MDIEEIRKKHESLVTGGYAGMVPSAKINYHTRTTIMACIDELEWVLAHTAREINERIQELKKEIE